MKKFMKGCGIAAAVMLVLGFIMATVTVGIHGTISMGDLVNAATHGRVQADDEHWDAWETRFLSRFPGSFMYRWLNLLTGGFVDGVEGFAYDFGNEMNLLVDEFGVYGEDYDYYDNYVFNNLYEIYSGDITNMEVGGSSIKNLDLEIEGCIFEIEQSHDDRFYVDSTIGKGRMQVYESKDGTLHVKAVHSTNNWRSIQNTQITLYVPGNYRFIRVEADLGAGTMYLGALRADEVELTAGAGEIMVDDIVAEALDMSAQAGNIQIYDMTVNEVEGIVEAGALSASGSAAHYVGIDCSVGSVYMELDAKEKDYNYHLDNAMGGITINGKSSWLLGETTMSHSSDRNININCEMGSVDLVFNE